MRWDAWCSMIVYTFATVAFYLLGAAILGRIHLEPQGTEMIRTLSLMYAPVFGEFTQILFLFGAFAVLYSTFFVANAGQARMCADAMQVTGLAVKKPDIYRRNVRRLSALFPFICLAVYWVITSPKELVMFSGLMQAMMLPMLSFAALYFRYKRDDVRILPGRLWDVFLIISSVGMLIAGSWAGYSTLMDYLK
jgi:Mn2+/Fe2+ NRAMP family transporter